MRDASNFQANMSKWREEDAFGAERVWSEQAIRRVAVGRGLVPCAARCLSACECVPVCPTGSRAAHETRSAPWPLAPSALVSTSPKGRDRPKVASGLTAHRP